MNEPDKNIIDPNDKSKQVAFNLGQAQLQHIFFLIDKASNMYMSGNLGGYNASLHALYTQISQRLSRDEIVQLRQLEVKIRIASAKINRSKPEREGFVEAEERESKIYVATMPLLVEYQQLLMGYLETKGYLIPLKDSSTSVFGRKSSDEE